MDLTKIFFAGMGTYLTPCVYPLIPIYLSSLVGTDISEVKGLARGQLLGRAIVFSIGFILVFSLMGIGAAGIGSFLENHRGAFQLAGGILVGLFALKFLGFIHIPIMDRVVRADDGSSNRKVGLVSSFLMGFFFAAGWSPCIGPILGSVLTYTASKTASPVTGMIYLTVYGLGFAVPLLITAMFAETGIGVINKTMKYLGYFEKVIGVVLLITAFYFFSNALGGGNPVCPHSADPLKPDGKGIMVKFYKDDCPICKEMDPILEEVKKTCKGKSIVFKNINIGQPENKHYIKKYRLRGVPTFVLISQKGNEDARLIGRQTGDSLIQAISAMTGESCPGLGPIDGVSHVPGFKSPQKKAGAACGASDNNSGEVPLCTE
ncbi:cytochrome c biogenesis protein/redoxin [Myxococcota bacterium]|nr:cytochrome c biogenesis protein/redoxin [Myxococcota bacterium]MBU1380657.1 cytochrome c biogenesis protein/redoxin [Myxococcota bacterium]MBU1495865.1 cytochrome c biogenesis protein/redoxin [Myxococcota bacterium]